MKKLWDRLLKIADVEEVEAEWTANGYFNYRAKYQIHDEHFEQTAILMYMKGTGSRSYEGLVHTTKKLKPEQLIKECLKMKCGISICKLKWQDEYGLSGFEETVIVPQVSSIEELKIWLDMHE